MRNRELFQQFEDICEEKGRDPASIEKSVGLIVAPPGKDPAGVLADDGPIHGSVEQIIDTFSRFAEMGFTRIEIVAAGDQDETIEGLAPVVAALGPT
ncbi:MAG: hypothetical protein WD269_06190 [Acidimicrobiia bacterium]